MRMNAWTWWGCALGIAVCTKAAEAGSSALGPDRSPPRPLVIRTACDLAPRLEALALAYELGGGRAIDVRVERSAAELAAACASGRVTVAVLPRDLTAAERGAGLQGEVIALDAVAFVVRADHAAQSLTRDELRRVWSGDATIWADGSPVVLFDQRASAAARALVSESLLSGAALSPAAVVKHESSMIGAIERSPGAIGFTFLSAVHGAAKPLAVDGVAPTPDNVRSGEYSLACPLVMVTHGAPDGEAARFIEFVRSQEGRAALVSASLVPTLSAEEGVAVSDADEAVDGR